MSYNALITLHPGDIYVDDHLDGVTIFNGSLALDTTATDLGAHDGTAAAATWARPGRDPIPTFVGRWTDDHGVHHGIQLPIEPDVENVYDFGPFRAVVIVS